MFEVAAAGEDHGHAVFVTRGDDFFILDGAARLNRGRDAGFGGFVNAVSEGEERVGCDDPALATFARFAGGDFGGVEAAHLARSDADRHAVFRVEDRV